MRILPSNLTLIFELPFHFISKIGSSRLLAILKSCYEDLFDTFKRISCLFPAGDRDRGFFLSAVQLQQGRKGTSNIEACWGIGF